MPSVGDLDWRSSQGWPDLLLESVNTPCSLIMPLRDLTGHEMHPHGLTASENGL